MFKKCTQIKKKQQQCVKKCEKMQDNRWVKSFKAEWMCVPWKAGKEWKKIPVNTQTGLITLYSKHELPRSMCSVNRVHAGISVSCFVISRTNSAELWDVVAMALFNSLIVHRNKWVQTLAAEQINTWKHVITWSMFDCLLWWDWIHFVIESPRWLSV